MDIPKYNTIVVDPPWSYGDEGKSTTILKKSYGNKSSLNPNATRQLLKRSTTADYGGSMTIDEIKDFELISNLSSDSCMVFLWTVNRYLYECPTILERWGFNIGESGRTMVWYKSSGRPGAQAPNQWESSVEFIVAGKKGSIKWRSTKGLKSGFAAKNEGHSIKPAEFYRMIKSCTHAPRVDIFARRRHDGFDAWGNQVEIRENDLVSNYPPQKVIQLGTGELHMDLCN